MLAADLVFPLITALAQRMNSPCFICGGRRPMGVRGKQKVFMQIPVVPPKPAVAGVCGSIFAAANCSPRRGNHLPAGAGQFTPMRAAQAGAATRRAPRSLPMILRRTFGQYTGERKESARNIGQENPDRNQLHNLTQRRLSLLPPFTITGVLLLSLSFAQAQIVVNSTGDKPNAFPLITGVCSTDIIERGECIII